MTRKTAITLIAASLLAGFAGLALRVLSHDRVVHGQVNMGQEPMEVVLYVPRDEPKYAEAIVWSAGLHENFLEEYIAAFNQQPYVEREQRLRKHEAALAGLRALGHDHRLPEAEREQRRRLLEADLIDQRVGIDRAAGCLRRL
jgi:hypothetical protein